ncbi:uncharacterized protein LOC125047916 [Penaeus chinensis]|uniref:uncharacterized protein LOC125047916 n=1 Tax=Penaeus chinensis TaxID=139456 RepID=UPI001FB5FC3D|nr:uncharacterized protein LOC125047916 [Penaeus chinensis]
MEGPAQKKRPNFSNEETLALIEAVATKKSVVLSKLDSRITAHVKNNAWDCVTKEGNLVARVQRNMNEVRRKFTDLRAAMNKQVVAQEFTNYTPVEEAMLALTEPITISVLPGVY